jgi:hypothetical protein
VAGGRATWIDGWKVVCQRCQTAWHARLHGRRWLQQAHPWILAGCSSLCNWVGGERTGAHGRCDGIPAAKQGINKPPRSNSGRARSISAPQRNISAVWCCELTARMLRALQVSGAATTCNRVIAMTRSNYQVGTPRLSGAITTKFSKTKPTSCSRMGLLRALSA